MVLLLAACWLSACASDPLRKAHAPTTGAPPPAADALPAAPAAAVTLAADTLAAVSAEPVLQPATPHPTLKQRGGEDLRRFALTRALAGDDAFRPDALPRGSMAVHAINVGQGDAFLVEFACGVALIDAGYQNRIVYKQSLIDYLTWFFQERRPDLDNTLNLVVSSHSHNDHALGFPFVLGKAPAEVALTVENVVDNAYDVTGGADKQVLLREAATQGYHPIRVEQIKWYEGGTSSVIDPIGACPQETTDPLIRVLWGGWEEQGDADPNPNHHSVVVRIDFGQASFLFTGDLQVGETKNKRGGVDYLLDDYERDLTAFDVDVLKVAHHGAANGTEQTWLEAIRPCIAMMGVGDPSEQGTGTAHDHGHPRMDTLKLLTSDQLGVSGRRPRVSIPAADAGDAAYEAMTTNRALFGTGWDGHYVVYGFKDGGYRVSTQHSGLDGHAITCR